MFREMEWQPRVIQLLAVPGLLLAYYLWMYHEGQILSACTVDNFFDCGRVSGPSAPYATIGPFSVALLGLLGYAAIFLTVWLSDFIDLVDEHLPELLISLTGIALLFTIYLKSLEIFVIGAICQYCLYSAILVVILFALSVSYLVSVRRANKENAVLSTAD